MLLLFIPSLLYETEHFANKWLKNEVVIPKYFSIQSSSPISVLKSLRSHKAFDLMNPNKVYALFGNLSKSQYFHSLEGYEFLSENVAELDSIAPSVAARICKQFTR